MPTNDSAGTVERREIRNVGTIHRSGNGNDHKVGTSEMTWISCDFQPRRSLHIFAAYLTGGITILAVGLYFSRGEVKTDGGITLAELDGKRQSDVAQPYDGNNSALTQHL